MMTPCSKKLQNIKLKGYGRSVFPSARTSGKKLTHSPGSNQNSSPRPSPGPVPVPAAVSSGAWAKKTSHPHSVAATPSARPTRRPNDNAPRHSTILFTSCQLAFFCSFIFTSLGDGGRVRAVKSTACFYLSIRLRVFYYPMESLFCSRNLRYPFKLTKTLHLSTTIFFTELVILLVS